MSSGVTSAAAASSYVNATLVMNPCAAWKVHRSAAKETE